MLDDLRRPPGIGLPVLLPAAVIVFDFDILIPRGFPDTRQGQTAFFRLIRRVFSHNDRVIHHNIHDAETAKRFYEAKASEGDKIIADARQEAQAIVTKAQDDAAKQATQIVEAANAEAKERQQRADEAIKQQEVKAQKAMQEAIVQVAMDASKELLGREVNTKDNEELVANFASQVQEGKRAE